MAALRCSSPGLQAAADSATHTATFTDIVQFRDALPFISKHLGIREVVVYKSPYAKPSTTVGHRQQSKLFNMDEVQKAYQIVKMQWLCMLQRVELHSCSLLWRTCTNDKGRWCPNLPALQILAMIQVDFTGLDVTRCPALRELHLEKNASLVVCRGLSTACKLQSVACIRNRSLKHLNLSGCVGLQRFKCDGDVELKVGTDLQSMQHLEVSFNQSLKHMDLRQCSSLQEVTSDSNASLMQLLLPSHSALKLLSLTNNARLLKVDLSTQSALERLVCVNGSLVQCDISACVNLQTVDVSFNDKLECLKFNGLKSLLHVVCTSNPRLTAVIASNCTSLRTIECSRNTALQAIDLAGCGSLAKLLCVDNSSLTSLSVSDCNNVPILDNKEFLERCSICTLGCPLLCTSNLG